jgi:SAM-dependent methyltransferase
MSATRISSQPAIIEWCSPLACCDEVWEEAYQRFETAEMERLKFVKRLAALDVGNWNRDDSILEIFCGRGNALHAWFDLGFKSVEGVDLSRQLLEAYRGPGAQLYVGDCRDLKLPTASRDIIAVHGGLHHLPALEADLPLVFAEVARVLRPGGRFLIVEPWRTPFLDFVHRLIRIRALRACWPRLDALAVMTEREADTYFAWLSGSEFILEAFQRHFDPQISRFRLGKWHCVARPR